MDGPVDKGVLGITGYGLPQVTAPSAHQTAANKARRERCATASRRPRKHNASPRRARMAVVSDAPERERRTTGSATCRPRTAFAARPRPALALWLLQVQGAAALDRAAPCPPKYSSAQNVSCRASQNCAEPGCSKCRATSDCAERDLPCHPKLRRARNPRQGLGELHRRRVSENCKSSVSRDGPMPSQTLTCTERVLPCPQKLRRARNPYNRSRGLHRRRASEN